MKTRKRWIGLLILVVAGALLGPEAAQFLNNATAILQ